MLFVLGLVLIIAAGVAIGSTVARRSHGVDDNYERDHQDLPIIGSTFPSGLN